MNTSNLKIDILKTVAMYPGLDDEQIADLVGIVPFKASQFLRELEAEGKISRASKYYVSLNTQEGKTSNE